MKINSEASYLFANRAQSTNSANRANGAASFAATLAEKIQGAASATASAGTADVKQADFTNMTRQEMRDWMNNEIRSGKMTLDESSPLIGMTMKIPVGGGSEIPAAGDNERIDFTKRARLGIEGALSRNDPEAAKVLQSALDIMMKYQGQTIGVATRA